jgi:hypothetical protein
VKIDDVLERVRDRLSTVSAPPLEMIARCALESAGLAIAKDGEVYDPTPAPAIVPRDERGARWPGSGRARRRR